VICLHDADGALCAAILSKEFAMSIFDQIVDVIARQMLLNPAVRGASTMKRKGLRSRAAATPSMASHDVIVDDRGEHHVCERILC
jgi:hypothetical protein